MNADFDKPFDFNVGRGRAPGERIDICPGRESENTNDAINVDERPFFLIEFFICERLNNDDALDHYGNNVIDIELWIESINDAKTYLESINDFDLAERMWIDRGYHELAMEIKGGRGRSVSGFTNLLQNLIDESIIWKKNYNNVFIFGI